MVTIHITRPNSTTYTLSFSAETLIIGRDRERVDIPLEGPRVSLRHARVRWRGERIILTDLRSGTGILVRGKRLTGTPAVLAPGESAEIAGYTVRFSAPHLPHAPPFPEAPAVATADSDIERLKRAVALGDAALAGRLYRAALRVHDTDAALEALFNAPPGEATWTTLTDALTRVMARPDASRVLERATQALGPWPDALRRAPKTWWQAVQQDHHAPIFRLARVLDLNGTVLPSEALEALSSAPALSSIRTLSLAYTKLPEGVLGEVLSSPHLSGVSSLLLRGVGLTAEGVGALRQASCLGSLRVLDLSECGLTDELLRLFLGAGEALSTLRELNLAHNALGPDGARALSRARHLRALEKLDVRGHAWQTPDLYRLKSQSVFAPGTVYATTQTP